MARCNRPECGRGEIDAQGFCTECDRRPLRDAPGPGRPAADRRGAPGGGHPPRGAGLGVVQVRPAPWWGQDLVDGGELPAEVEEPPLGQHVREEHRYCVNSRCRAPVGRGHGGRPGRVTGYCPDCATPFDFSRPPGSPAFAERYRIRGVLGSGGGGAAYLAYDRNLGTDVVLKVLHRTSVVHTEEPERNALVGLRHDSIVRILSYERENRCLVLEYVRGTRLAPRAGDRLEVVLGHGLQILQALDYLHARGLLHCDVKPANIIRFTEQSPAGPRDRVRLIDFGAVRRIDDASPLLVYSEEFAPPKWNEKTRAPDPERERPTAGFDLFCLGRTLQELCRPHLRAQRTAPGVVALDRLLERATCLEVPGRRFRSAQQFAEQLSGVIRQVVAERERVSRVSALFGPVTEPLHGGLGTARPLEHWIGARVTPDRGPVLRAPFACPSPLDAVVALPAPLADPDAPPGQVAQRRLAECRTALRGGQVETASRALRAAELPAWDWLHSWYGGLIALAGGRTKDAAGCFASVRAMLPGELVPLLALGLCAELDGDLVVARTHYEMVAGTAPRLGAAGFGLARVHLLAGRREEAVAALEPLTHEFRFEREAWVATVRALVAVPAAAGAARPTPEHRARAGGLLAGLDVDPVARIGIGAEIQLARHPAEGGELELSEAVRRMAAHAATERDHTALVDLANRLRPPLTRPWPGLFGKIRRRTRPAGVS